MTIPHYLPLSSSEENTKGKRQPLLAEGSAANLDDDDPVFLHASVSFTMFVFFVFSAIYLWTSPELLTYLERDWHLVLIDAIVFLYSTAMIHLLLIKRRNNKQMQHEFACKGIVTAAKGPPLTSVFMLVAIGIMIVALGVTVFVFRPNGLGLAVVALFVLISTAGMFFLLKAGELERKKSSRAKSEHASDKV